MSVEQLPFNERHPGTQSLLRHLKVNPNLPPHLAEVSVVIQDAGWKLAGMLHDGPELVAGLRKLIEAKDCFVRQAVDDRTPKDFDS